MKTENQPVIETILRHIRSAKRIIISGHTEGDGDSYGSQYGLSEILKETFPEKEIFIGGTEQAMKPFPPPDNPTDSFFPGSLILAVDTANSERVAEQRWNTGGTVIKIDHHPFQESFGHVEWIDTSYPSCCEMIFDLAVHGEMRISPQAARMLFLGMVTDTGRFRFPGVGEETFHRAAALCGLGVNPAEVYDLLYSEKESVLRFRGYVYNNYRLFDGTLACMKIPADVLNTFGLKAGRAGSMVNLLSELEGVRAWAFFCEDSSQKDIKVELRSRSLAINTIAVKYGGGGHRLAAGARVKDWATVDAMIEDLRRLAGQDSERDT